MSGLAFVSGSRYPSLGDSFLACESHYSIVENVQSPGVLRRLVLSGAAYDSVSASDVIVRDCKGDVSTAPDGTVYYANNTEIPRLLPGAGGTAGTATFVAAGTATSTPKR